MVNNYTQTEDLSTSTSVSESYNSSGSNESLEDNKVVAIENIHDKAYEYLESLEVKYAQEIDILYEKAGLLMDE
jgi:hypothetical protein